MTVTLQRGEAAGGELEVPNVEFSAFAPGAQQDLAGGAAKFAAPLRGGLVRLDFHAVPSKAATETAKHLACSGCLADSHLFYLVRAGPRPVSRRGHNGPPSCRISQSNVTTTFNASGFCAVA